MCLRYAVKHICIGHVATGHGACDVRDVLPAIGQCRSGFCIIKLPVMKTKFQVISKAHVAQIMHNENKKVSAYRRYTPVWATNRKMLPHPHL
jgi:hypothetical protein